MSVFRRLLNLPEEAPARKKLPADAAGWCAEAQVAEELGDWSRAVVCYRRALERAPYATDVREKFEMAVENQIRSVTKPNRDAELARQRQREAIRNEAAPAVGASPAVPVRTPRKPLEPGVDEVRMGSRLDRPLEILPASRRAVANAKPSTQAIIAIAGAVLLTGGALYGAVVGARWVGGFFNAKPETLAQKARPSDPADLLIAAAVADMEANRFTVALGDLRSGRTKYPDREIDFNVMIGSALSGRQRFLEKNSSSEKDIVASAREWTKEAAKSAEAWESLGRALARQARSMKRTAARTAVLAEAQSALDASLKLSPNRPTALLELAKLYETRENKPKAAATYEKLLAYAESGPHADTARGALKSLKTRK